MRPRLLDLFCGAGGAAVGYHQAGFDVIGVDHDPQPNYPFEFVQADIGAWSDIDNTTVRGLLYPGFDAIHASPPCQAHTLHNGAHDNHPDLIEPIRELLEQTGPPYVIENVPGAPLLEPFTLCGTMFPGHQLFVGLEARELHRHRLFETNWDVGLLPQCQHRWKAAGVYGDHLRMGRRSWQGEYSGAKALELGSQVMGIDWMTWPELTQAIPPAYTQFIGERLLEHLRAEPDRAPERGKPSRRSERSAL